MPAGFMGSGEVYFERYNPTTATWGAEQGPFEANQFEITPKATRKVLASRSRARYGQAIATVTIPEPPEFAVRLTEVTKDTLALALFGTVAATAVDVPTVGDPAGYTISGATQTQIRARFRFEGANFVSGQMCRVTIREAVLAPTSPIDFLADDFATVSLAGLLETPSGEDEPFTVRVVA